MGFTAKKKIAIVMESLKTDISTEELCRKYRVSPSTFARWMGIFIGAGKESMTGNRNHYQKESDDLRRIISEYAIANKALKESIGMSPSDIEACLKTARYRANKSGRKENTRQDHVKVKD